jgi:uncharacterized protein (TIGR03437 family)
MKKPSLVWREARSLVGILLLSGALVRVAAQVPFTNSIGRIIPLSGHINEVALDEARGLVYAGNFSAGTVDVVSIATKQVTARYTTAPVGAATTGMALSPNKKWIVATYFSAESGVSQFRGLTRINLNDPTDRLSIAMGEKPLAVAFSADNVALIVTSGGLWLFDPETGQFRQLLALGESCPTCVDLPVDVTIHLPREVSKASVSSSLDARWIFGQSDAFIFSYLARPPVGTLLLRPNTSSQGGQGGGGTVVDGYGALVREPIFQNVSGSPDGSSFMAGHMLFNRELHVMADTPVVPENFSNEQFVGGNGFDPSLETNTAYFSFVVPDGQPGSGPDHPINNILYVMDANNLRVRQQLRTAEQITGRIVVTSNGNDLFAVSESGLLHIAMNELNQYPVLEVRAEDRFLTVEVDACERGEGVTRTIHIENPAGGPPAQFSLSAPLTSSGQRPAIRFQPSTGVTPADVKVTVDVGALGPVQGATTIPIQISTDAINIPQAAMIVANIHAVDQRGTLVPSNGRFIEVVGDPFRDRYYAIDQDNFDVVVFDSTDNRIVGRFPTGNTPTQGAVSRSGERLFVANAYSEGMTVVNLNSLTLEGMEFLPWQTLGEGHYPYSVTADNSNRMLIGVRRSPAGGVGTCGQPGRVDFMHAISMAVTSLDTFGVVSNCFGAIPAVAATPDGSRVLLAESDGFMQVFSTTDDEIIFTRQQFAGSLQGTVGAGPDYFIVENHIMNSSLVPRGQFPDTSPNVVSSGFAVTSDGVGVRSVRPLGGQVDTGAIQRIDGRDPSALIAQIRLASPPLGPSPRMQENGFPFTRSLSALRDGRLVSTSSAGVVELPKGFDTGFEVPVISAVTSAADFTSKVGSGGLISIFGRNLAPETAGAVDTPLPRKLGNACVTVNGESLPLLYVSPTQINAQLSFATVGPSNTTVHSASGISDVFVSQVDATAPTIFKVTGPDSSQFAAVFRSENFKLATLSNPLRQNEIAIIYATGLGQVSPLAVSGVAATTSPLQIASTPPVVEFGGAAGEVLYAGLAPGFVGLYQLNVRVPGFAPLGMQVPLTITMGANTTSVSVRIID